MTKVNKLKMIRKTTLIAMAVAAVFATMPTQANNGSVRISVSGEVIPGAAQRGCPLYLRCSMPDLMR